jgi:hypothetical protein
MIVIMGIERDHHHLLSHVRPDLRVWCSGNMRAFQALVTGSIPVTRFPSGNLFLLSSAVERTTVNRLVPGSIPGGGAREINSEVECLLYTQYVTGSIPVSPIPNSRRTMTHDHNQMQRMQDRIDKH